MPIIGKHPGNVMRELAFNVYISGLIDRSSKLNIKHLPGRYIMSLPEDIREILRNLKSEDLTHSTRN